MPNILAIVGRPNVGKSTLFNRLVEQKQAITDNVSGVTRDRHYGFGEWNGKSFTVIDTGGYVESDDIYESAIRKQVITALEEATVILFMVECFSGVHPADEDFVKVIREINKPVFLIANKADNSERMSHAVEFHNLGLGVPLYCVSAASGFGTGEMLDGIVKFFDAEIEEDDDIPKVAILGRPNVGKSSLVNALVGQERSIVTDKAGTTRDAVNTRYQLFGKDFILSDTAGIRKKSKVTDNIEFYSVLRAVKTIQNTDVSIMMIDAKNGLESQDMSIIGLAHKYNKGIVLMVNKWDLLEKETQTAHIFEKSIKEKLGILSYIPVIFTSVIHKQRIMKVLELALEIYDNKKKKIPTSKLNDIIGKEIENYPPPAVRGNYIKIKYITQLPSPHPIFAFFCNYPQHIKPAYERYLINKIREHFDFKGVPIKVIFRKK